MGKYLDKSDWVLIGKSFGICVVIILILAAVSRGCL